MALITANGQSITAPTAKYYELTQYPDGHPNDPIYYFDAIENTQLTITPLGGGSYTFSWFKYNPSSQQFDLPAGNQNGSTSSIFINEEGGYMVRVDDGMSMAQDFYCWTFEPKPDNLKINFGGNNQCFKLELKVTNGLVYYNHKGDHSSLVADHSALYTWNSDDTSSEANEKSGRLIEIDAPYLDTEYSVTITNSVFEDQTLNEPYEAVAVNAEFDFEIDPLGDNAKTLKETTGPAPMKVDFKVKTKISDDEYYDWTYDWDFGENKPVFNGKGSNTYTYRYNGTYTTILTVSSQEKEDGTPGCKDSHSQDFTITDFEVLVPNAFTPFSSPGQNDEFRVHYSSVKTFSMLIYNRWGRKVFQTSRPEEGWDGRINGKKAEPGVYYYQIDAKGYNDGESFSKSGPVHLVITK